MNLLKEKLSINFVINNNVTLQLPHPVYAHNSEKGRKGPFIYQKVPFCLRKAPFLIIPTLPFFFLKVCEHQSSHQCLHTHLTFVAVQYLVLLQASILKIFLNYCLTTTTTTKIMQFYNNITFKTLIIYADYLSEYNKAYNFIMKGAMK